MTEPVPDAPLPDLQVPDAPIPDMHVPGGPATDGTSDAPTSWWLQHRRQVWLWLAFLAAVTAPIWGGLILLLLFSPSSPFPKG